MQEATAADETGSPVGSMVEELVPSLGAALGELRRSPGRSTAWVGTVLQGLERGYSTSYDRLRRRLGFAHRLAHLARLARNERATATLGLFFHEILTGVPHKATAKPTRAWTDYLLRNLEWLEPCLRTVEDIDSPAWDDIDAPAPVVARVAVIFDRETLENHSRPLEVIRSLPAGGPTPAVKRIVPLLSSEDGQELCDHHFRRRTKGYSLDAGGIRDSLEILRPATPRPVAETPTAPPQPSGSAKSAQEPEPPKERAMVFENFEQRRRALRSSSTRDSLSGADSEWSGQHEAPLPEDQVPEGTAGEPASQEPEHGDRAEELWLPPTRSTPETERASHRAAEPQEEEYMEIQRISSARAERPDGADLAERLNELRSQFGQIQRFAEEGQALLDSLAPQLEEFASWIADLETVVGRWKGHAGAMEDADDSPPGVRRTRMA